MEAAALVSAERRKLGCGGGTGGVRVGVLTTGADSTGGTPMSSLLLCRFMTGEVDVDDGEHREKAPHDSDEDEDEDDEDDVV